MTIAAPEIEEVTVRRVSCHGREGALGHPLVYLQIGSAGYVDCPYCDKRFVLKGSGATAH
ncbi:MAG: zinc-finger domain-containing protein [Pseudomonadota bacterium]